MPIREFFHLIHVVDDMDEANEWYDAVFSPQCFQPKGYAELEKRWATLSMIGDFMIEVIEPSDAPEDQQAPLPKFRGRFGQHFHSLAFFVDVPDLIPLFKRLRMNGVRIAKPGGGMFAGWRRRRTRQHDLHASQGHVRPNRVRGSQRAVARARPAVLGRIGRARGGATSTRSASSASRTSPRSSPISIGDVSCTRPCFDGRVLHEEQSADAESVFVFVGSETVVEMARPTTSDSRLASRPGRERRAPARADVQGARSRSRRAPRREGRYRDRRSERRLLHPRSGRLVRGRLLLHGPHDSGRSARLTRERPAGGARGHRHRREPRHRQGDRARVRAGGRRGGGHRPDRGGLGRRGSRARCTRPSPRSRRTAGERSRFPLISRDRKTSSASSKWPVPSSDPSACS